MLHGGVPDHVTVVFDEAYYEFLDDAAGHAASTCAKAGNVVVLRTFSKIQGLANLRIGYGIAPAESSSLQKTRQPFNANGIAQAGALAGLPDDEHQRKTRDLPRRPRLLCRTHLPTWASNIVPSYANFVLVNVGDGRAFSSALLAQGHHRARDEQLQAPGVDARFRRHDGAESALHRGVAGGAGAPGR